MLVEGRAGVERNLDRICAEQFDAHLQAIQTRGSSTTHHCSVLTIPQDPRFQVSPGSRSSLQILPQLDARSVGLVSMYKYLLPRPKKRSMALVGLSSNHKHTALLVLLKIGQYPENWESGHEEHYNEHEFGFLHHCSFWLHHQMGFEYYFEVLSTSDLALCNELIALDFDRPRRALPGECHSLLLFDLLFARTIPLDAADWSIAVPGNHNASVGTLRASDQVC